MSRKLRAPYKRMRPEFPDLTKFPVSTDDFFKVGKLYRAKKELKLFGLSIQAGKVFLVTETQDWYVGILFGEEKAGFDLNPTRNEEEDREELDRIKTLVERAYER